MTIKFKSSGDADKVKAARKNVRPSYYDVASGTQQQISLDMEAALILIPSSARQEANQRLDDQNQHTDRVQKRDAILVAALKVDQDNADQQITELERDVTSYQDFQGKFATYAEVGEIGLLLRDAQLSIDEMLVAADRAKHRYVCSIILQDSIKKNGISVGLDKERRSWSSVLTSYSGM